MLILMQCLKSFTPTKFYLKKKEKKGGVLQKTVVKQQMTFEQEFRIIRSVRVSFLSPKNEV